MFDVFYTDKKPGLFSHEKPADSLDAARELSTTEHFWWISGNNDYTDFNWHWQPPPWEYNHVFTWPSQWQREGGVYLAHLEPGPLHYMDDQQVLSLECSVDIFVVDMHNPGAEDSLASVMRKHPTAKKIRGAVDNWAGLIKKACEKATTNDVWVVSSEYDYTDFDFTWYPDASQTTMFHIFGTSAQPWANVFRVHKEEFLNQCTWHIDIREFPLLNFVDDQKVHAWSNNYDVFYQEQAPGIFANEYRADNIQTAQEQSTTSHFWWITGDNNYTSFDWSFVPPAWENEHIHVWPSQWQKDSGVWLANTSVLGPKNYRTEQAVHTNLGIDIFVVDKFTPSSKDIISDLQDRYPGTQVVRGVGDWAAILKKCCQKSVSEHIWVCSTEYTYESFDFTWHPDPSQNTMFHVFGSAHQPWSNVFYVHREEFLKQCAWHNDIKDFPLLNFVEDQKVQTWDDNREIYRVTFGTPQEFGRDLDHKKVRFFGTWLDTINRIVERTTSEYVWVVSELCDYTGFDFGWAPEPWEAEQLHCWSTGDEREGDTFFVPVEAWKRQQPLEKLSWFQDIHYHYPGVKHRSADFVYYSGDLAEAVKEHKWVGPYGIFTQDSRADSRYNGTTYDPPSMWAEENIIPLSPSGSVVMVPRSAAPSIKTQLYDWPYILRKNQHMNNDDPLDVVFISNGEDNAAENLQHLHDSLRGHSNTVHHVEGVNGRTAAYRAAAERSESPYFFAVFAKLRVNPHFDWKWQPDYLQGSKHWIFKARNPVNGLCYGHQAMIVYNVDLVLGATDIGLDFTLSAAHTTVPLVSGTANFHQDPLVARRTAFREVLKLLWAQHTTPSVETEYRLHVWQTQFHVDAPAVKQGVEDALAYWSANEGDYNALLKSYEWDWLDAFFKIRDEQGNSLFD